MEEEICVIGLGYVGLPLAVAFRRAGYKVYGLDVNISRVEELKQHKDLAGEVSESELRSVDIEFTSDAHIIHKADFIVVCVPTPIDKNKLPDLRFIASASQMIGENLKEGAIVVFESTVYPGVTEEVCLPLIETASGLKCPESFKIGYSPERINPGDKEHSIENIVKVVSAIDDEALERVAGVYSKITKAGIFKAKSIKTAEAAKVIENIQRDLNIALMNERALIFERMGIKTKHVLEAAGTKWNFHKYVPGLVGGHCIGVDPYYLTFKAEELGFHPKVILAGRSTNDYMPMHIVKLVIKGLNKAGKVLRGSRVLLLGLTFKENVRDARNSKARDLITGLKEFGIDVQGYEPNLSEDKIRRVFGINAVDFNSVKNIDCTILVNSHSFFSGLGLDDLKLKMTENPVIVDIKFFFDEGEAHEKGFIYYTL